VAEEAKEPARHLISSFDVDAWPLAVRSPLFVVLTITLSLYEALGLQIDYT
jgi:hypothetical protein